MQDQVNRARRAAGTAKPGADVAAKKTGKKVKGRALTPKRVAGRVGLSVGTVIALVLVAAIGAGFVAFRGPSESLGDLLTVTMLETSALKFIPRIYYSKAEVDEILARNSVQDDGSVQLNLFQLDDPTLGAIRAKLEAADLNNMTPMQAFDLLRAMKEEIGLDA